jgi:hypothetical protein
MGGLKQGDCVAEDLDTISDGAKAPTVPCDQPHLTQVLGFVDLTGLEDGPFGFSGESQVIGLCGAFMKSFDLQPPIYSSLISASLPSEEEWDAGSRIMLVWVGAHGEMWTGSALDYSAALVK